MTKREIIKHTIGPSDRSHIFMLDEKEVGYALTFRIGDKQLIVNFEIAQSHRNRGYGRLFYKELEKKWRKMGIQSVVAQDINTDATEFWRKMGFNDTGSTVDSKHSIFEKSLQYHTH